MQPSNAGMSPGCCRMHEGLLRAGGCTCTRVSNKLFCHMGIASLTAHLQCSLLRHTDVFASRKGVLNSTAGVKLEIQQVGRNQICMCHRHWWTARPCTTTLLSHINICIGCAHNPAQHACTIGRVACGRVAQRDWPQPQPAAAASTTSSTVCETACRNAVLWPCFLQGFRFPADNWQLTVDGTVLEPSTVALRGNLVSLAPRHNACHTRPAALPCLTAQTLAQRPATAAAAKHKEGTVRGY